CPLPSWVPCKADLREYSVTNVDGQSVDDDDVLPTNTIANAPIAPIVVDDDLLPTNNTATIGDPPAAPAAAPKANPGTDGTTPYEGARDAGRHEVATHSTATIPSGPTWLSAQFCRNAGEAADYLQAYLLGADYNQDCVAEIEDVTVRQGGTQEVPSPAQRIAMRAL
ncbi:MAG: hypothetical protein AAFR95_18990, partial [Bacteroidota bacterium]